MSKWVTKYTCPGFMVVRRKPWSIVDCQSYVMFAIEFHDMGKTLFLSLFDELIHSKAEVSLLYLTVDFVYSTRE